MSAPRFGLYEVPSPELKDKLQEMARYLKTQLPPGWQFSPMVLKRDDDFHAAAQNLIEMACDAVETCTATQQLLALEKALQRDGFEKVPRVLVLEIAGHLSMLAQGHVPPNLKEQAADLLVKVGNILSE